MGDSASWIAVEGESVVKVAKALGAQWDAACEWRDGHETWAVLHDSESGADHWVVRGVPPVGWEKTRDRYFEKAKKQAKKSEAVGVDYLYEIPQEVARLVVGFRVDE
jgi:hypothetical protein